MAVRVFRKNLELLFHPETRDAYVAEVHYADPSRDGPLFVKKVRVFGPLVHSRTFKVGQVEVMRGILADGRKGPPEDLRIVNVVKGEGKEKPSDSKLDTVYQRDFDNSRVSAGFDVEHTYRKISIEEQLALARLFKKSGVETL